MMGERCTMSLTFGIESSLRPGNHHAHAIPSPLIVLLEH